MKKIILLLIHFYINYYIFSEEVIINFTKDLNYRQTYNDCALYSIKAISNIINKRDLDIKYIRNNIKERLRNNYTLPWGIENFLRKENIKIKIINISYYNDIGKIKKLKNILRLKHPIIILIGLVKYQHYITLLGYKNDFFLFMIHIIKKIKMSYSQ